MKVIMDKAVDDLIYIDDITNRHIVVAIINNQPCILVQGDNSIYKFCIISNSQGFSNLTSGNGYSYGGDVTTVKDIILQAHIHHPTSKIRVYEQRDWADALQFLIDNA